MKTITSEYLLLLRGTDWDKGLSPDQVQKVMTEWNAWYDGLVKEGKIKGANPLAQEGKILTGKNGATIADGPFTESKEAVAGYFLLQVANEEEAIAAGQKCPALEYGMIVEVRPVLDQCPLGKMAQERALAAA